ncbi:unnamed protein product [Prorocentrum cordatum]|uniref:Uncharacterized protein n=1 Tax=Prorocentrum cordatum TaxID=2364126 RepID=A0ABN9PYX4_9DINO|nr:unnamed protein product [Polarella glacialis]CAK0880424.1 unnamed protein product [Polarella glacialis]
MMSEAVSSVYPGDYADEVIRDLLKSAITVNDTPFTGEGNHSSWQAVKMTPATPVHALRVHDKCCKETKPSLEAAGGTASSAAEGFTKAMNEFVKSQSEEIGLAFFPKDALPNVDQLIKWEAAGKVAAENGRPFLGSTDGGDLQVPHRPAWSRTPVIEAMPAEGSWEDRLKASFEVRKARAAEEKTTFHGFATFIGHLYSWDMKLCFAQVCTATELLAYIFLVAKVAEESGGVNAAYQYDLLARREMARAFENGEDATAKWYFTNLDRDMVREARDKAGDALARASKKGGGRGAGSAASAPTVAGQSRGGKTFPKGGAADNRQVISPSRHRSRTPAQTGRGGGKGKTGKGEHRSSWTSKSDWGGWKDRR